MKTYVLDTNVLLTDPDAIYQYAENTVLIPLVVLEELDNIKTRQDETGKNARASLRQLDALRQEGDLSKGVVVPPGIIGVVGTTEQNISLLPKEFSVSKMDHLIIACALGLKNDNKDVVVVSNDLNVRIKCDSIGLSSVGYSKEKTVDSIDAIYSGVRRVTATEEWITEFYKNSGAEYNPELSFKPNEFLVFKDPTNRSAIGRFRSDGRITQLSKIDEVFGLKPRNKEQQFALELLFDENVKLVTLAGASGTGKTLISIAAALQQVTSGKYKKLIVSRPVQPLGKDIGFLPGPQPLDAKILTPDGWTTMGNLKVGSFVIGRDGKSTKVIGIYPKGKKDIYKVETTDGTSTECCEDHLWYTQTAENKKRNKQGSIKSTKQLIETLVDKKDRLNHYLPRNEPVEFTKQQLKIPPYTLGALLGDGSICAGPVIIANIDNELIKRVNTEVNTIGCKLVKSGTISYNIKNINKAFNNKPAKIVQLFNNKTNEIISYNSVGIASLELNVDKGTLGSRCLSNSTIDNVKYSFVENNVRWQNQIKNIIFELGLYGTKAYNKFIPSNYLYSSIDDRIALLQGLMDTDGTIKKNGEASFATTSKQLANDVVELVRSLGGRATLCSRNRIGKISVYKNRNIIAKAISYEFTISLPSTINPFYISRKASRHKCSYIHSAKVSSIKHVGAKEVQCIMVENPEHLYITDQYIVTHNTLQEKMEPWIAPIKDNLNYLFGGANNKKRKKTGGGADVPQSDDPYLSLMMEKGIIEVEAITFIRGRSIPNAIMIIDECQNLSMHELKTILTRVGEGTKIILTGDIEQIDNMHVDSYNNGLTCAVEKFKDYSISGHITLLKGERSELATLASQIL